MNARIPGQPVVEDGKLVSTNPATGAEVGRFEVAPGNGAWNYPVLTPIGSIGYALVAGNAVVFKPREYTPAAGQWLVDRFAEVVPEHPVLQIVHGGGKVGDALCRAGADKVAFT